MFESSLFVQEFPKETFGDKQQSDEAPTVLSERRPDPPSPPQELIIVRRIKCLSFTISIEYDKGMLVI